MYILSRIQDLIRVPPLAFNVPIQHAIIDEIHKKYLNKVINGLGLAILVWDLLKIDDGMLKTGDGGSYVDVEFRLVVFKPFVNEIIQGWVAGCTEAGIKLRLDFFDDIWVPKEYLFENCTYKSEDNVWVWHPDPEDPEGELFFDINEKVRFRVEEEMFVNTKPKLGYETEEEIAKKPAPYWLKASMQLEGMGCISWWD